MHCSQSPVRDMIKSKKTTRKLVTSFAKIVPLLKPRSNEKEKPDQFNNFFSVFLAHGQNRPGHPRWRPRRAQELG